MTIRRSLGSHLERWLVRVRRLYRERLRKNKRAKRIILALAFAIFLAGVGISIAQQPEVLSNLAWRPVVIVLLVTVPLSIFFRSLEYYLLARQIGLSITLINAAEITVISSAANMLPLPGGPLVRIAALRSEGASYRSGIGTTLLGGLIWVGVSLVIAGGAIATISSGILATGFLVIGALTLVAGLVLAARTHGGLRIGCLVVLNRAVNMNVMAARYYFCLAAIGHVPDYAQAAALTVSGVVGAAVFIVPAGLGVRELVAAAMAPIVLLSPALGFLAASLSRILNDVALLSISAILALRYRRDPAVAKDSSRRT